MNILCRFGIHDWKVIESKEYAHTYILNTLKCTRCNIQKRNVK